jgi:hypothetical protein
MSDDNDARKDLMERLKGMKEDELLAYQAAASSTNRFINIAGVACMFCMVSYPTLLVIIPCAILTYVLANVGAGVDITIGEIKKLLEKFDK